MRQECKHTRKLRKDLRSMGCMVYPMIGSRRQPSGWPDSYVAHASWRGFLECKDVNYQLQPHQRHVMTQLRLRGEQVWTLRFVDGRMQLEDFTCNDEVVAECNNPRELLSDLITLEASYRWLEHRIHESSPLSTGS
jgi:hypothetical protein